MSTRVVVLTCDVDGPAWVVRVDHTASWLSTFVHGLLLLDGAFPVSGAIMGVISLVVVGTLVVVACHART